MRNRGVAARVAVWVATMSSMAWAASPRLARAEPAAAPHEAEAPAPTAPATPIAPTAPPLKRDFLQYRNLTALRLDPLGIVNDFRIGARHRLFSDPRPLYRDAHVGVAGTLMASPAWSRVGVALEAAPLSILQMSLQYEVLSHYGILGTLQSFGGSSAYYLEENPFKSPLRDASARGPYASVGHVVSLNALLQMRFGPIVVRSGARFMRQWIDLRDGDRAYYDSLYDILAPGNGWLVSNDLDVWYYPDGGHFIAGLRHSLVKALYANPIAAAASRDGSDPGTRDSTIIQRAGPVLGYTFFDHPGARFNAPTVLLIANWWLQHPYRTSWKYEAMPFIGLAFTFRGEL